MLKRVKIVGVLELFSITPLVMFVSAAVVLLDVFLQRMIQGGSARATAITAIVIGGIGLSSLIWVLCRMVRRKKLAFFAGESVKQKRLLAKSFVLSFQFALVLLVVAAHLAIWKNHNHFIEWYRYGFLDKRWLFCLYWIGVSAVLVFPPLIHRVLGSEKLASGLFLSNSNVNEPRKERTPKGVLFLKTSLALSLSFVLFGPPWNIERTPLYIDFHEQVHLGPLQAVYKGYLPNIGPASQQYGPGTQLVTYAYMKYTDQFTLIGFRQAHGLFFFLGFSLFATLIFIHLGVSWGVLAILVSLSVSPFNLTYWNKFGGFNIWGWPNPLRYLGVLFLVMALASILTRPGSKRKIDLPVLLVGWFWGMFTWLSPENLILGFVASGLFASLLWATATTSFRRLVETVVGIALGGAVFWSPFLVYYWHQGHLGEYTHNIFMVGGQVIAGLSNIPTSGSIWSFPERRALFYGFTPFVLLVGCSVLYKNLELRRPLNWNRDLDFVLSRCIDNELFRRVDPNRHHSFAERFDRLAAIVGLFHQGGTHFRIPKEITSPHGRGRIDDFHVLHFFFSVQYGLAHLSNQESVEKIRRF